MEENEYEDNEKVLYKAKVKLILPHKKPEEADCFVTEGHVVIELEEPIKIPLSRIKDCNIIMRHVDFSGQVGPSIVTMEYPCS